MRLNKSALREVEDARARLTAYKAKIETYPSYLDEKTKETTQVETRLVVFQVPSKGFQDIKGDVVNLRRTLTEHLDRSKKQQGAPF